MATALCRIFHHAFWPNRRTQRTEEKKNKRKTINNNTNSSNTCHPSMHKATATHSHTLARAYTEHHVLFNGALIDSDEPNVPGGGVFDKIVCACFIYTTTQNYTNTSTACTRHHMANTIFAQCLYACVLCYERIYK